MRRFSRRGILPARTTIVGALLAVNVFYPGFFAHVALAENDSSQSFSVQPLNYPQTADASLPENIHQQIVKNWAGFDFPPGIEGNVQLSVSVELDRSGKVVGTPAIKIVDGHLSRESLAAINATIQKVLQLSSPFKGLPVNRYDDWSAITLHLNYVKN